MAEDLISKMNHNKKKLKSLHEQTNENTTPQYSKNKSVKKTLAVDLNAYIKLKIVSAKTNTHMIQVATDAINYALKHKFYNHNN